MTGAIALQLSEDVYGANGDLSAQEIKRRLIGTIRRETDIWQAEVMPIWQAADLLLSTWRHMDELYMGALAMDHEEPMPEVTTQ